MRQFVEFGNCIGTMKCCSMTVLTQPCIEIASYAPMRTSIRMVWSNIHFDDEIALKSVVFSCRCTYYCIVWKYDDAIVTCTYADFVFCTNHTVRLNTTQF